MDLGLKDRRAFVAAASKGLGLACATALAGEGARVFISSRDENSLRSAAEKIAAAGWRVADVSKPGEPEAAIKAAIDVLGGLDILIVNAGGPRPATFADTSPSDWDAAHNLTLMSAVRMVHAALPQLRESGQGRIVFITSIAVRQPIPNLVLSNSERGAVTGLSKSLAIELGPHGVTSNCLAPGTILTDRIRQLAAASGGDIEDSLERMAAAIPVGRIGTADEFGAACAFLCSRQAGYITGQTIGIDGGALAGVH